MDFKKTVNKSYFILFIIFILFLPIPYRVETAACVINLGNTTTMDCTPQSSTHLFFGIDYLVQQFFTHTQPWSYLEYYQVRFPTIPLWMFGSFILPYPLKLLYRKYRRKPARKR